MENLFIVKLRILKKKAYIKNKFYIGEVLIGWLVNGGDDWMTALQKELRSFQLFSFH
jgi:hypothetical protein